MKKTTRRVQLTCVLTVDESHGRVTQRDITSEIRLYLPSLLGNIAAVKAIQLTELDEAPYTKKKVKK